MIKNKIKKVIFLGRKSGAVKAIRYLLHENIKLACVVTDELTAQKYRLISLAQKYHFPLYFDDDIFYKKIINHDRLLKNIDLVISYVFWKKIKAPLFKLPKYGCINFHPAPLPTYKGRAGYNKAILDESSIYGASVHFIDSEEFDVGPIIATKLFSIDSCSETALSLERKTHREMFGLFRKTLQLFNSGKPIKTQVNQGGCYLTKNQLEDLKQVNLKTTKRFELDKKIRAFFFPPHSGVKITVDDNEYTLINKEVLEYLAKIIRD